MQKMMQYMHLQISNGSGRGGVGRRGYHGRGRGPGCGKLR